MAGAGSQWAPQPTLRLSPDYLTKGPPVPQSHAPESGQVTHSNQKTGPLQISRPLTTRRIGWVGPTEPHPAWGHQDEQTPVAWTENLQPPGQIPGRQGACHR